ncbi:MAG TPA: NAD-dependent succinate-semialdehyde dehydrogenase [Woeseiaceae bacterium]|nr:NAD-dependent succinate-semialdehyde dehydrogenase [Woeseiaceae bacterium]
MQTQTPWAPARPAVSAPPIAALLGDAELIRTGPSSRAGDFGEGGNRFRVTDPASGATLGHVASASAADTEQAVAAAAAAWPRWRGLTANDRALLLERWAASMRVAREDLARIVTLEQGKPIREARAEIDYAASFLLWFAAEGERAYGETIPPHLPGCRLFTTRQPVGVTAAITPWNFPSAMIARKAGAALAAGCPMIVRPAEETPFSALALAVLAERAGIPAGVFSVLPGPPEPIAGVLASSPAVRAISFTGSTRIGRRLLAQCASTVKRVSLELGGHAPFVVFGDVDLEQAVDAAAAAKFQTTGQDCLAANRILVARPLYRAFCKRFAERAARLRVGPGMDEASDLGPLMSRRAVEKCQAHVDDACAKGARLLTGGRSHPRGGTFYEPTVLADLSDDMQIWSEETFGPVAAIAPFDGEQQALSLANDTEYGLAAYVYTHDLQRALRVSEALQYGMVAVNRTRFTGAPVPFGGVKQSGLGREGSRHGLDEYLDIHYVCIDTGIHQ